MKAYNPRQPLMAIHHQYSTSKISCGKYPDLVVQNTPPSSDPPAQSDDYKLTTDIGGAHCYNLDPRGDFMAKKETSTKPKRQARFVPDMDNFRVSLAYEGMTLKQGWESKSVAELKRKYAR